MRVAVFVLLLTCVACRSTPREKPKRDYYSMNRHSWQFLKESARDGYALSKRELRQDLSFRARARVNLDQQEKGRAFLYQTLWLGETYNLLKMLGDVRHEVRGWDDRAAAMRFGFLDFGE